MSQTKKKAAAHYSHIEFQKTLGEHCRKLRTRKGYSVNRLARESERLSPDQVLRLERGEAVTTPTLYRYAEVLGVSVKVLFDFPFSSGD